MIDKFVNFFCSLKLTIVCLALALVLVFAGTLAQVSLGLYVVQSEFFRSFFIYWTPGGGQWKIPIYPGGWLIGLVLVVNLLCAHIKRFSFTRRKIGLFFVHAGLILLLAGFFFSEIFRVESQIRLETGQTMNYAEDSRRNELVVIDTTSPDHDTVTSIPQDALEKGGEIHAPGLPFALRVKHFLANSAPAGPMSGPGDKIQAANGIGHRLLFAAAPLVTRMDDEDKPAAVIEVVGDKGTIGEWTVSTWMTKHPWSSALQGEVGGILGMRVDSPQSFTYAGRTYNIALRPVRYYTPYTITLLEFKHDVYAGTDIPSNFSSRVHLRDPARGEDRDVVIRMNSPLRYAGQTYYQASFEQGDKVSILEVVHNPAAATPYVACALIGFGLVVQFMMHLFGFAKKRARSGVAIPLPLPPTGGTVFVIKRKEA